MITKDNRRTAWALLVIVLVGLTVGFIMGAGVMGQQFVGLAKHNVQLRAAVDEQQKLIDHWQGEAEEAATAYVKTCMELDETLVKLSRSYDEATKLRGTVEHYKTKLAKSEMKVAQCKRWIDALWQATVERMGFYFTSEILWRAQIIYWERR